MSEYATAGLDTQPSKVSDPPAVPRPIHSIGVLGAGLMASQFAMVFAQYLKVPVLITDLSQAKVDSALAWIGTRLERQVRRGQLGESAAVELLSLIRGTVDKQEFQNCDVVIEAVFEELSVKRAVLSEIEPLLRADALLLTNTSSLSVAAMGQSLTRPERMVGLHFFNPVDVMPLVEIIRTEVSDDVSLATARSLAGLMGKTAVLVKDTPGFVVNRILTRLICELLKTIDEGTDIEVADHALDGMGLPMTPLTLLAFIGPTVQLHICETMHAAYPDRFYVSTSLRAIAGTQLHDGYLDKFGAALPEVSALLADVSARASAPVLNAGAVKTQMLEALAEEVGLMLAERVVESSSELDLCMLLGANFPKQGGLTRLLDSSGASQRVWGRHLNAEISDELPSTEGNHE